MAKPKENTIIKIDELHSQLLQSPLDSHKQELISALAKRCHTMNINKAKLAYFKDIKVILTRCLVAAENGDMEDEFGWQSLQKEVLRLLHAKNG